MVQPPVADQQPGVGIAAALAGDSPGKVLPTAEEIMHFLRETLFAGTDPSLGPSPLFHHFPTPSQGVVIQTSVGTLRQAVRPGLRPLVLACIRAYALSDNNDAYLPLSMLLWQARLAASHGSTPCQGSAPEAEADVEVDARLLKSLDHPSPVDDCVISFGISVLLDVDPALAEDRLQEELCHTGICRIRCLRIRETPGPEWHLLPDEEPASTGCTHTGPPPPGVPPRPAAVVLLRSGAVLLIHPDMHLHTVSDVIFCRAAHSLVGAPQSAALATLPPDLPPPFPASLLAGVSVDTLSTLQSHPSPGPKSPLMARVSFHEAVTGLGVASGFEEPDLSESRRLFVLYQALRHVADIHRAGLQLGPLARSPGLFGIDRTGWVHLPPIPRRPLPSPVYGATFPPLLRASFSSGASLSFFFFFFLHSHLSRDCSTPG
ncbi:hypothetical protein H696_00521 [Fonticula alba]|uniref:Uncharacterized protein n=1 Tax=Fonticula alba TaxID=691883 RepID=A0A058ZGD1_FONAL|nr:hypothetical protein H696_00521 [Fonticula alba]KCV72968.1 hypothetical protein H696_00521 [Fonticula alba]|eukprot:XP_009492669.1 hypothetical protein H696_00521 [Fonticula alba]